MCLERRGRADAGVGETASGEQQPASRRRRVRRVDSDDEYNSLIDMDTAEQRLVQDEVQQYLLLQDFNVKASEVLQWWKSSAPCALCYQKSSHAAVFPTLSRVARLILATPAASAPVERVFSRAERLISPTRTCLATDTVDDYLFLNDFIKSFGLEVLSLDDGDEAEPLEGEE
ncbi:uncharacterized protein LOC117639150 isoform X2 [Thrips palmi]|nr:uncharacterized protein LOC117639150 isoform X2 [Thrips palmi]